MPTHVVNGKTDVRADRVVASPLPPPSPVHSEKKVQFNLDPQGPSRQQSPERPESEKEEEDEHRRRRKYDERSDSTRESGRRRKRHHRDESPGSDTSDATIDLPARFDEHGRKQPEDALADKLESVLASFLR